MSSTPALFMNGASVPYTEMNVQGMKALIDAELAKAAAPQNRVLTRIERAGEQMRAS